MTGMLFQSSHVRNLSTRIEGWDIYDTGWHNYFESGLLTKVEPVSLSFLSSVVVAFSSSSFSPSSSFSSSSFFFSFLFFFSFPFYICRQLISISKNYSGTLVSFQIRQLFLLSCICWFSTLDVNLLMISSFQIFIPISQWYFYL